MVVESFKVIQIDTRDGKWKVLVFSHAQLCDSMDCSLLPSVLDPLGRNSGVGICSVLSRGSSDTGISLGSPALWAVSLLPEPPEEALGMGDGSKITWDIN